jgi:hypothetical protein
MFCLLSEGAHKTFLAGHRFSQFAALTTILCAGLFFSSCGSAPGNSSAATASNSAAGLSVTATLPTATVGAAYSGELTASGGTPPYTFSTSSGDLPQGVTLNSSTGTISGAPAASGISSFSVLVSDSKGLSKRQPLQITVANATDVAVSVTPSAATVSASGSAQLTAQVSNTSDTAVTWTASQGTISSTGLYSAPQVTSDTTVNISATSVADPSASASASITITPPSNSVSAQASTGGNSFSNLQRSGGWGEYGQQGPNYVDCSPSPCDGIAFWMNQGVSSPSMSGDATEYDLGGTAGFSDALWNNHLIGPSSSQGMSDGNQSIVPSLHNFTYDVYFFGYDLGSSQALEFDINQFFGNMGFIFGHECRIAGGNQWDVWDDQSAHWIPTGIPCYPKSNAWNHLTIKVQRTSNNQLTYQSITLNGVTSNLNWTYNHGSTAGWYGLTINYQMDGNQKQSSYNVYLDNLTFSYD